jgi:DNA-binding GntR family transcriptional regulator
MQREACCAHLIPERLIQFAGLQHEVVLIGVRDHLEQRAEIACEIGAEIVEGAIAPGSDLNTVELARRYQTSRTPVREALILLENEGLVDIEPRRRPRAHAHSIDEVQEIYTQIWTELLR